MNIINRNNYIKKIMQLTIFVAFAVCAVFIRKTDYLNNIIHNINDYGVYAPILYVVTLSVASNFFFPMSVLVISGGLLFGSLNGFFYSLFGGILSALLGYSMSKILNVKDSKIKHNFKGIMTTKIKDRGLWTIIIIRLTAIPFAAQNFLSSMVKISFKKYLFGSILGMIPWLFAFSFFGDAIVRMKYYIIILSIIALIVLYVFSFNLTEPAENK